MSAISICTENKKIYLCTCTSQKYFEKTYEKKGKYNNLTAGNILTANKCVYTPKLTLRQSIVYLAIIGSIQSIIWKPVD